MALNLPELIDDARTFLRCNITRGLMTVGVALLLAKLAIPPTESGHFVDLIIGFIDYGLLIVAAFARGRAMRTPAVEPPAASQ